MRGRAAKQRGAFRAVGRTELQREFLGDYIYVCIYIYIHLKPRAQRLGDHAGIFIELDHHRGCRVLGDRGRFWAGPAKVSRSSPLCGGSSAAALQSCNLGDPAEEFSKND